jgi:Integrase zinc binding domain
MSFLRVSLVSLAACWVNVDSDVSEFVTVGNCKLLCKKVIGKSQPGFQLIAPLSNRKITIQVAHDMNGLEHYDVLTTVNNILQQNIYWPTVHRDVDLYIGKCVHCIRKNFNCAHECIAPYQAIVSESLISRYECHVVDIAQEKLRYERKTVRMNASDCMRRNTVVNEAVTGECGSSGDIPSREDSCSSCVLEEGRVCDIVVVIDRMDVCVPGDIWTNIDYRYQVNASSDLSSSMSRQNGGLVCEDILHYSIQEYFAVLQLLHYYVCAIAFNACKEENGLYCVKDENRMYLSTVCRVIGFEASIIELVATASKTSEPHNVCIALLGSRRLVFDPGKWSLYVSRMIVLLFRTGLDE